MFLARRLHIFR